MISLKTSHFFKKKPSASMNFFVSYTHFIWSVIFEPNSFLELKMAFVNEIITIKKPFSVLK